MLVVPKSMAMSVEKTLSNNRKLSKEIPGLPSRSAIKIIAEPTNNYARTTQCEPPAGISGDPAGPH